MKNFVFAAAFCASVACAGAGFAATPLPGANGNVSAGMMPNGDVKMTIKMPPAEFAAMKEAMKDPHDGCKVAEVYPGESYTMVLVCGQEPVVSSW